MTEIDRLPAKVVRTGGTVMTFEGPRRAFKKVEADEEEVVATLIVKPGDRVVYPVKESGSWNNEHLRVEAAYVEEIDADTDFARSIIHPEFSYQEGERIEPEEFDADESTVSAPGIHVFATREGAEHW